MMRYSVREDDPGYLAWQNTRMRGSYPVIYLDGVEQKSVVTADDEAGYVLRHVLDDEGRAQVNPENSDEVWTEEAHGQVEFQMVDLP